MRTFNKQPVQGRKCLFALILLAFFISTGSYGQYDYFQWSKTQSYSTGFNQKSTGSGMAVDQFDRTFYVANLGASNRVYWDYGDLLGSAPAAASLSNLVFLSDNAGDHLLYIDANNKVAMTEYLYANSAWTSNSAYAITEVIAQGPSIAAINTNNVYYIRASDKQVCNLYTVGNTLYYAALNTSLPPAAALSNLEINNGRIFYIKSNRTLGCLQWSTVTNNWASITLPNAPAANSIAVGSRIRVEGSGTSFSVFYVGTDQRIHQYYSNPSVSGNVLISSEGPLVQYMSDISMYSYNEINYVGQDGNVHCLYYTGCDWAYYKLNGACSIGDGAIARGVTNKIFFYSSYGVHKIENQSVSSGFVYRKHNKLGLNGGQFNPIGINYMAMINSTNNGSSFFLRTAPTLCHLPAALVHYQSGLSPGNGPGSCRDREPGL